jgi:hypothetical protein
MACPVTIDIHNSYFSLGDSRRRGFLPDTGEADIINSLQIGRTRRPVAGYFEPIVVHELRRKPSGRPGAEAASASSAPSLDRGDGVPGSGYTAC